MATANYTPEQVKRLVNAYEACDNDTERKTVVEQFADALHKTPKSVIAKLSSEKIYIKPKATTKAGGVIRRKADIVADIAVLCGVEDVDLLGSLEKATKQALEIVQAQLEHCSKND